LKRKIFLVAFLLTVLVVATACNEYAESFENGSLITASQARNLMEQNPYAIILDVRTQSEFDALHIPNAILIPNEMLGLQEWDALSDKGALILVYCRSGSRSEQSVRLLVAMGYTNVLDFGGILSWPYEIISN